MSDSDLYGDLGAVGPSFTAEARPFSRFFGETAGKLRVLFD